MILAVIRILFISLVAAVALAFLSSTVAAGNAAYTMMVTSVVTAIAVIMLDFLIKRKNLAAMSGLFFGILVGILVALALDYLLSEVLQIFFVPAELRSEQPLITGIKLLLGLITCYLSVSLILQTRDDFRFVIPYVEFTRGKRGTRPFLLDTSAIIDGRIADLAATGIFESRIIVPRFVINELQAVADSQDKLKRGRGRRGLDVLHRLQTLPNVEVHIWNGTLVDTNLVGVDQKLVSLARQENGRIVTNDFNLNKVAAVHGVQVLNLHELANAIKPTALPGETMRLRIIKIGEAAQQGVGYLDDGTMVVVEGAREHVGREVPVLITNTVQTSAGRMIFGRLDTSIAAGPGTMAAAVTGTGQS
ncbi:MAG: PIN/TRAM domain-containing protein [Phycisphaerae bacterium]